MFGCARHLAAAEDDDDDDDDDRAEVGESVNILCTCEMYVCVYVSDELSVSSETASIILSLQICLVVATNSQ